MNTEKKKRIISFICLTYSTMNALLYMLFGHPNAFWSCHRLLRWNRLDAHARSNPCLFIRIQAVCVCVFYVNAHYANVLTVAEMDFYIKLFVSSVVYVYAHRAS